MSDVPDEILREILSRLPVAPLLRFRCVSKSWKGLIDNQQFTKHHLNHSRKTNSNLNIILRSGHLYSADFDLLNETNQANFQELSHPLKTPFGVTILGSCDGLLVLRNDKEDETILWNPSVRRFHEIPCTGIEFPGYNEDTFYWFGFGYDVVSDDYKLISIVQFSRKDDDEFNSEVNVYSLKSDSWRRIPDFPYYIMADWVKTDGVLANGALHWIVTGIVKWDTNDLVAAFDLGTEEYRLVPLPKFAGDDNFLMGVAVLGGCLSLIYNGNDDHVDVWVMKEYGVQESWSILFTFDDSDFHLMKPIAYSKCGRKVLLGLDDKVFMWYDLDKKSTDVPMVQIPLKNIYDTYTCLQSLVLLNNRTCDFDLVTKKKQERKDNKRSSRKRKDFLAMTGERVLPAIGRPNGHE